MRVEWIEIEGKKVLFEDYSNLKGDELLDVLYKSEEEMKKLESPVRILLDFTGCTADTKFMNEIKRVGKQYDNVMLKAANVGVNGIKKVLAKGYLAFTGQAHKSKYFDTMEEARRFLAV